MLTKASRSTVSHLLRGNFAGPSLPAHMQDTSADGPEALQLRRPVRAAKRNVQKTCWLFTRAAGHTHIFQWITRELSHNGGVLTNLAAGNHTDKCKHAPAEIRTASAEKVQ